MSALCREALSPDGTLQLLLPARDVSSATYNATDAALSTTFGRLPGGLSSRDGVVPLIGPSLPPLPFPLARLNTATGEPVLRIGA
jgi:hypothetical protein